MCVCVHTRACNVCVRASMAAVLALWVLVVHGLSKNGFSQDGVRASIPLNGGNYTVSIMGGKTPLSYRVLIYKIYVHIGGF